MEQQIIERDPLLQSSAPVGRRLRGYQLGPQIGEGAFGRIYRASQPALGREVAIKVIRPELADSPEFIRRFDAEAKTVARLEHPHIVPLFDYWREPGGAYLVMRYLRGGTAQNMLESHGPLSLNRLVHIVDEIGGALATAHAQQVVHRDVKPANILFDEQGASYLGDFGVATGLGATASPLTASVDSALYLSPEQADGEVTERADIYAFGAVLYELLTGKAPFGPSSTVTELIERKQSAALIDLRAYRTDLPRALEEVIARATAPKPTDRFDGIGEMLLAFHTAVVVAPGGGSPVGMATRNPYKGLAAFDEADAADFFGRDELVRELQQHLNQSRFVAVVGPSGSGKSSVVRAGLSNRLRVDGSYVLTIIPGQNPIHALTEALLSITPEAEAAVLGDELRFVEGGLGVAAGRSLPDGSAELVLVVDQFEELFTVSDANERDEFLELVANAVRDDESRVRVVVTVRADFYDRPLSHTVIGELVRDNSVALAPLSPAGLEQAISSPAARVGVGVETALVAALVADFSAAPSGLPLLQYELTELFERRDGDALTESLYRQHGGLGGAVARRADEIYECYDDAGRAEIRQLFGRLVEPGEGAEDTRRRVRQSELSGISPDVVDVYADARLLTLDHDPATREPTVEVAHEALIREWPRLRGWVDADRDNLRTLRHMTAAADGWEAARFDTSELYRGSRLLAAEEWAMSHPDQLSDNEEAFLAAGLEVRNREAAGERRRVRRLRFLAVGFGVFAVLALVAGVFAFTQQQEADDNAAEAERRALENMSAQLATEAKLALTTSDPDLSILLALAAYDTYAELGERPPPGVVGAVHETVQASRLEQILPMGRTQLAISPDGQHAVFDDVNNGRTLIAVDLQSEAVSELPLDYRNGGLAYSPDGEFLAVSFADRNSRGIPGQRDEADAAMLLLDPITLETVQRLDGGLHTWLPSWSADSRSVLALAVEDETRMWNVGEPAVARTVAGSDGLMVMFVAGTNDIAILTPGRLDITDRDSGEALRTMDVPESIEWMAFAPGGDTVALVDYNGRQVLVAEFGADEPSLVIDHPSPRDVHFSPDGTRLSMSGNSDSVRVVDLQSAESIELRGHGTGSSEHWWHPDGDSIFAATIDGSTRVWDLRPEGVESLGNLALGGALVGAARLVGDSAAMMPVVTGSSDAEVRLVDVPSGANRPIAEFWFGSFQWPVISADASLVAGFSQPDRLAHVVEADSGDTMLILRPCETPKAVDAVNRWVLVDVRCADPSQDVDESQPRRGFVDIDTGELRWPIDESDFVVAAEPGPLGSVSDGVVAYHTGTRVVFVKASTGEEIDAWRIPPGFSVLALAFSPDGTRLGASAQSRQGILFDVEAIMAGTPAGDAVKVYPEMSTGPTHMVAPVGDYLVTTHNG
ncbi:MAG: protein kinase domain-containing protein, partial [Acidimicrobiales bacterium]